MSTNFYLTHKVFEDSNIRAEWMNFLHLGKSTMAGFSLQAMRPYYVDWRLNPEFNDIPWDQKVEYRPDMIEETIETWREMKALIFREDLCLVDEYYVVQNKDDFVRQVESQEDRGYRTSNDSDPISNLRYHDPEGYSFCGWVFS